jgi:anti-anti-sigma factor
LANGVDFSSRIGSLEIQVERVRESRVVRAVGQLDAATGRELEMSLRFAFETGDPQVTLDLTRLSFIDAFGIRVLVWATDLARTSRIGFRIHDGSPAVHRVYAASGADRLLPLTTA